MILTALRVLRGCWPALLAWFLAGWAARALLIRLAGYVGDQNSVAGLLLLPLAILAELAAFVGMFLAVRRELPHLERADDPGPGEIAPSRLSRASETLLAAILPFFLLYIAWNLIRQDLIDYGSASLVQSDFSGGTPYDVPFDALTVGLVIVAFVIRWLLGRFAERLPRWTAAVATYLEAVWVLIALVLAQQLLGLAGEWFATRRMFGWAVDAWAVLREQAAWIGTAFDGIGWTIGQIGTVVGLPLAWLAVASIVYFGSMPRVGRPSPAVVSTASARWQRMPVWLRKVAEWLSSGFLDRWRPVALAARLIWRSGPVTIGIYVLAWAVVTIGGTWLQSGIYRLVGPHDTGWWYGASDVVGLIAATITTVLQIAIVAAAFDTALRSDAAQRLVEEAGELVSEAAEPGAAPPAA